MLTKKQKLKLLILTQDPKYGQLLADAIEIWSNENIKPIKSIMGLKYDDSDNYSVEYGKCCLQGAALASKNVLTKDRYNCCDGYSDIEKYFNLTDQEAYNIRCGFDGLPVVKVNYNTEAYEFGKKVAQVVFGN